MSKTVILINPNDSVVRWLQNTLGIAGCTIITVTRAIEYATILRSYPDLLVLDTASDPHAIESCRFLKERLGHLPILVIVGSNREAELARRAGADEVYDDPVSPDGLVATIEGIVRGSRV